MSDQRGLDLETIPEGYARFPGIDADGYGTHDIQRAVGQGPRTHPGSQRSRARMRPFEEGFIAKVRP